MAKPSRDWIYELILALLMVTQGEARKSPSYHRRLQLATTTATIKSVDTPFVRVSEPGLTTQKVAARPMQTHDEAHNAVGCRKSCKAKARSA